MEKTTINSKDDLIILLENWLNTNETTISNGKSRTKNTKWIILNLNKKKYFLNADTRREGVKDFVNYNKNKCTWQVIKNNRNVFKKVTNHPKGIAIPYLYFYTDEIGQREI